MTTYTVNRSCAHARAQWENVIQGLKNLTSLMRETFAARLTEAHAEGRLTVENMGGIKIWKLVRQFRKLQCFNVLRMRHTIRAKGVVYIYCIM